MTRPRTLRELLALTPVPSRAGQRLEWLPAFGWGWIHAPGTCASCDTVRDYAARERALLLLTAEVAR